MSKASEWIDRTRAAESVLYDAEQTRPPGWALQLNLKDKHYYSVEKNGMARLCTPEARNGYEIEPKDLLALAQWIVDTFGNAP